MRNPWDRLVSYYHWLRGQSFAHPAVALARQLDFAAFLRHGETQRTIAAWPAARYMRDRAGTEHCTAYVRLEHLDEDLAPFEAHLGFSLRPLERVNRSERPADYRRCYDDETAAIVARICAEDIARFGYRF